MASLQPAPGTSMQATRGPQPGSASVAVNKTTQNAHNYASTVATQSDVAKYRGKYKELKAKIRDIEAENDEIHLRTLNLKRTIQRMRLERAVLYERLEAAQSSAAAGSASMPAPVIRPASPPQDGRPVPPPPVSAPISQPPQPAQASVPSSYSGEAATGPIMMTLPSGERVVPSVLAPPPVRDRDYATQMMQRGIGMDAGTGMEGGMSSTLPPPMRPGMAHAQSGSPPAAPGTGGGAPPGGSNGAMKVTLRRGGGGGQQQQQQMGGEAASPSHGRGSAGSPPS